MVEVVAALIWYKDKFMICQRPANKARGLLWEFVGGKVEMGESMEQALIRECREELAITLSVGQPFMEVRYESPDLTVHLALFNAAISAGAPQLLEHSYVRWITVSEIDKYPSCPVDKTILTRIQETKSVVRQTTKVDIVTFPMSAFVGFVSSPFPVPSCMFRFAEALEMDYFPFP